MVERGHPTASAKDNGTPPERYQPAPGIPPIVIECFADAHTYGTIRDLSMRQAATSQEYYGRKYLGDGEWGPNMSLADIKKEEDREIFHMLLRSCFIKITQRLPSEVKAKYFTDPDDNTWFLKEIDNPSEADQQETEEPFEQESSADTPKRPRKPARGIPSLAQSVLDLSKTKGLLEQLNSDELAFVEEYYTCENLGKGKIGSNFSVEVDIEDEKEREEYKETLYNIMNDLLEQISQDVLAERPSVDDMTWFLKKVDTNLVSQTLHRKWKDPEYRAAHSKPKSVAHRANIKKGVRKARRDDPTIISRIVTTAKNNSTPEERSQKARQARLAYLDEHVEIRQQLPGNLANARDKRRPRKEYLAEHPEAKQKLLKNLEKSWETRRAEATKKAAEKAAKRGEADESPEVS
jgi:hypothetical protein